MKAFSHETGFVVIYSVIEMSFDVEHPLATDGFVVEWRDQVPRTVTKKNVKLGTKCLTLVGKFEGGPTATRESLVMASGCCS